MNLDTIGHTGDGILRRLRARGDAMVLPPDRPRFRFLDPLGAGGMGAVFRAWDAQMGAMVAAKQVLVRSPEAAAQLKHEFRVARGVSHPNLVTLYELVVDELGAFFTMELVPGADLVPYLRRGLRPGEPLPSDALAELRRVFAGLVDGVRALHRAGIVHRDLKPGNVLVTDEGRVVVLDLGVAVRPADGAPMSGPVGTPSYMAPEQVFGSRVDGAADAFAVGCILHEAMTGQRTRNLAWTGMEEGAPPVRPFGPDDVSDLCVRLQAWRAENRATLDEAAEVFGFAPVAAARVAPRRPRFVDRVEPRLALDAWLRAPGPTVVEVRGPPGVGVTALLGEVLGPLLDDPDFLVARGRCDAAESVPFGAWDHVVDTLSERLLAIPPSQVEDIAPRRVGALLDAFPVLGRVAAFDAALAPPPSVDAIQWQTEAFDAFASLLDGLGRIRRGVLVIDDIQEGDEDSARLLAAVLRDAQPNVAIVLAGRSHAASPLSDVAADAGPGWARHRLELGPLALPDARDLLVDLGLDAERADLEALAAGAEGSPYLLGEVAFQVREGWTVRSVDEAIGARVATLDADARGVLEAAAVADVAEAPGFLAAVAGLDAGTWEAIYRLRSQRLLRPASGAMLERVELHHDRVGRVVRAGLSAARRRALHARAAEVLALRPGGEPARRARHLVEADQPEPAAACAMEAGALAEAGLAFATAAEHYRLAAALQPSLTAWSALARALVLAGKLPEAGQAFLEAAALAEGDAAGELRRAAGEAYLRAGDAARGLEIFGPLLRELGVDLPTDAASATRESLWRRLRFLIFGRGGAGRGTPDAAARRRMDLLWSLATGLSMLDPTRGDPLGLRHLAEATSFADQARRARAYAFEAANLALVGVSYFTRTAQALAEEAEALAAGTGTPADRAWALLGRSSVAGLLGDFRTSAATGLEAEQLYLEHCRGVDWELMAVRTYLNGSLAHLGEVATLCERVPAGLEDALRRGHALAAAVHRTAHPALAWLWLDRPDVVLDPDGEPRTGPGVPFSALRYWWVLATTRALLYRGDVDGASARLADAWGDLERAGYFGFPYTRLEMYVLRVQVAVARGEVASLPRAVLRVGRTEAVRHAPAYALAVAAMREPGAAAFDRVAQAFAAEGHGVAAAAARWRAAQARQDLPLAQAELAATAALGIVDPERYFVGFLPISPR